VVEISVKFPKDYADTGVAGKAGEFSVELLSVQEKHLPEVNEEFLKKIGGYPSAEALKDEFRKSMETHELRKAKESAYNEAIDTLIKENQIELAPSTVEACTKSVTEDYLKRTNGSEADVSEEARERFRDVAVMSLKRMKIVDHVAEKEKIKATQEEVDKEIMQIAQTYGQDFEVLKQMLRKDGTTNRIRMDIRERKTLDFLIGESNAD